MVGHHVSLCPSLCAPIAAHPAQPQPSASTPSSVAPLNPSATSWVGSADTSEGKVALQTTLAVINGKKESRVRVLFDTGSHTSFITAEAVCKLGLKPVRREELGIKVFGSKEAVSEMRDVVEFSLSALNDRSGVKIEAFVVKDISSIPNVHIEQVKKGFLHLSNVWFADVVNDCLHVGPSLTPMIFDVLLRFRVIPVATVSDIEKAFLNIGIHPEDRDSLRFLWVDNIYEENPEVVIYKVRRVYFGCNASPFLLNCVLRHHIERYKEEDPEFVHELVGGFFVDDLVTGSKDIQDALALYEKAKTRLKDGGFTLRKWKTNKAEVAKEIAYRECELGRTESMKEEEQSYAKETLSPIVNEGASPKCLVLFGTTMKTT